MTEHPDEELLELYMLNRLPSDEAASVTAHLINCDSCQRRAIREGDIAIDVLSSVMPSSGTDARRLLSVSSDPSQTPSIKRGEQTATETPIDARPEP